jgi:hypothetical protein
MNWGIDGDDRGSGEEGRNRPFSGGTVFGRNMPSWSLRRGVEPQRRLCSARRPSPLFLTTTMADVIENNMEAVLIEKSRTAVSDTAFFETVLWHVPTPVAGSSHHFKYRLALIVNGECVMRYDNERGKGDHRHLGDIEEPIEFTTLEALFDAFQADMERILA